MKETIDFSTFVLSLGTSVQLQMGLIPEVDSQAIPGASAIRPSLEEAKHTIDILAMLQEKTKGNLTKEEETLMTHLLYELRMRYVALKDKG